MQTRLQTCGLLCHNFTSEDALLFNPFFVLRQHACCRSGESKAGIQGLLLLLKRIRLIAERNAASPAERLLDDCLRVLANPALEQNEIREVNTLAEVEHQWR